MSLVAEISLLPWMQLTFQLVSGCCFQMNQLLSGACDTTDTDIQKKVTFKKATKRLDIYIESCV